MPTYLFKVEKYNIIEETEIEDEGLAPQTLMNMDMYGTGSLAINAIDGDRAVVFCKLHMSIHKNWDNPGFAL